MTMISFGQSATFPGFAPGQHHDAYWTKPIPKISWSNDFYSGYDKVGRDQGQIFSDTINLTIVSPTGFGLGELYLSYDGSALDSVETEQEYNNIFGVSEQSIMLMSPWNSVKNIEISTISSHSLTVGGFVDTWIAAPTDNDDHLINLHYVKRGAIALGNGNDTVNVNVMSNEYNWSNHFNIVAGNGNDVIDVQPEPYQWFESFNADTAEQWGLWNQKPQLTSADVVVGNGNDTVTLTEVSGTIHVGSGNDTINIADGNSDLWLGAGNDTIAIGTLSFSGPVAPLARDTTVGTSIVHVGSGHADISIDDTGTALTPKVTLDFTRGEIGGGTPTTADTIRIGHSDPISQVFVGGNLSCIALDFFGYGIGSTAMLSTVAGGDRMLLEIHDAGTGGVDMLALYGNSLTSAAELNLHFT